MTQTQQDNWMMWSDFENKMQSILHSINAINDQCDGNSKVGYNVEVVRALKVDLLDVLDKYQLISENAKDAI